MDTSNTLRPAHYQIRVQGHLDARWSEWFDGLTIEHSPDDTTTLAGPIADQAALHGVLTKIGSLGLPLLALSRSSEICPRLSKSAKSS